MKLFAKSLLTIIASFSLSVCATPEQALSKTSLAKLLVSAQRTQADIARDESRKPADVMYFSDIAKGDHVLDLPNYQMHELALQ